MANNAAREAKGNVFFVDVDKSYTINLKPQVRFVDASEYNVKGPEAFYGFLAGILSGNYDISELFIDGLLKQLNYAPIEEIQVFFDKLNKLVAHAGCDVVISYSEDASEVPESIRRYEI